MTQDLTDLLMASTGERSIRAIALRAGYDPSTLTRQVKAGIKAETVVEIARAYGLPPVRTLVRFGFLTEAEALEAASEVALTLATDEQLAQEILDRVRSNAASAALTDPIGERLENVTRLDDHRGIVEDDERAVASEYSEDRGEDDGYDA